MKKLYFNLFFFSIGLCPTTNSVELISPNPFEETTSITTISGSTVDEAAWELRIILYIYGLGLMIPMIQSFKLSNGSWTSSNEVINLHIQPELIFTDLLYTQFL
jgi:hypothetical protein